MANVYGTVIMAKPLREFTGSFGEYKLSVSQLPTLKQIETTRAVESPCSCYHSYLPHPCHLLLLTSPKDETHFTISGRQKAVYTSALQ